MTPHFWNTSRSGNTYDVRGKWVNWLAPAGWRSIDTAIQGDRTVTEMPYEVEFPVDSQGVCSVNANGRFSMSRHITERNGSNPEPSMEMTVQALTQSNVTGHADPADPSRMLYPEAWPGADLRYGIWHGRSARIEKVVEIDPVRVALSGDLQYKFLMRSNKAKAFLDTRKGMRPWQGLTGDTITIKNRAIFIARGDSELRGLTLRPAVAWYYKDGELVREPIRLRAKIIDPETVEVTKEIPASLVRAAGLAGSKLWTDATFYPDADPETSTVDGYTQRNSIESWGSITSGAGTQADDTTARPLLQFVIGEESAEWGRVTRPIALFDTSSISGTVDSATFSEHAQSTSYSADIGTTLNCYGCNPASNTALAISDYQTAAGTAFSDTGLAFGSLDTGDYNSWAFNSSGLAAVDTDGITKLCLRSEEDADNSEPTHAELRDRIKFYTAEQSGTGQDPKIEVTTAAVTTTTDAPTTTTVIPTTTTTTEEPAGPSSLIPDSMMGGVFMANDNMRLDDNDDLHLFGSKVLRAVIDSAGTGDVTIVAAVAGKRIRVVSTQFKAAGVVSTKWTSSAAGTTIDGVQSNVDGSGQQLSLNPAGWFETIAGEALVLNKTAAVQVGGSLLYTLED